MEGISLQALGLALMVVGIVLLAAGVVVGWPPDHLHVQVVVEQERPLPLWAQATVLLPVPPLPRSGWWAQDGWYPPAQDPWASGQQPMRVR